MDVPKYNPESKFKRILLPLSILILVPLILFILIKTVLNFWMDPNSDWILILAFVLGIKHSFDADHLIAVSNILINSKDMKRAMSMSASWALGHMLTASVLTIVLFVFRESIFSVIFENVEKIIPFMLILIALVSLAFEFKIIQFHKHEKDDDLLHTHEEGDELSEKHIHAKEFDKGKKHGVMLGIGILQGIASNDELLILLTVSLNFTSILSLLFGILFFTLGVVFGMIIYSFLVKYPIQKWGKKKVTRSANIIVATFSIIYAIYLLLGSEGLNLFEIFM